MPQKQHPADREAATYRDIEATCAPKTRGAAIAFLICCTAVILSLGILVCALPRKSFSEEENRTLAAFPSLTLQTLSDGTFTGGIADFLADQFPGRTAWITAKAAIELSLGKLQNNHVILGNDGYLITEYHYGQDNYDNATRNIDVIARLSEALDARSIPFTFAIVPRSVDVNTDKLPALYDTSAATRDHTRITEWCDALALPLVNLTDELRTAADEQSVWYKTDHHWNTQGAYVAYCTLAPILGYEPLPLQAFYEQTVTQSFLGTAHASSGMHWIEGEPLTLLRYQDDDRYTVEIIEGGKTVRSLQGLYDLAAAQTHDEYNVFLGGTNTIIRVSDPTRADAQTLVLIKDSFSQSLAPFLAQHFDLLLIDPRTYDPRVSGSVLEMIEQENANRVLLLYGIDTLYDSYSLNALRYGLNEPHQIPADGVS